MAGLSSLTVFADCGVTPNQAQYRHVGEAIARKKAQLVCVACNGEWPRALVDSTLAHGGSVTVCAGGSGRLDVPRGVTVEISDDMRSAGARAAVLGQALVALPGGLGAISALYRAWIDTGGAETGKPVGMLNRHGAFEVVRGFMTDIAAVGRGNVDHLVQFSDSFEDLWTRLARIVD